MAEGGLDHAKARHKCEGVSAALPFGPSCLLTQRLLPGEQAILSLNLRSTTGKYHATLRPLQ